METTTVKTNKTRKITAISAGILVLGLGATYTLATWKDSEWVWGGVDGDPGIGTSTFEVQQSHDGGANWLDNETNPGEELAFTLGALSLSPGDSTYAPVALSTTEDSVAATVTLQEAVAAVNVTVEDDNGALWDAIEVDVYTANSAVEGDVPDCDAEGVADSAWTQITEITNLDSPATATQSLAAARGDQQNYCFVLTLPAGAPDSLQGRTIAPAWEFVSESV